MAGVANPYRRRKKRGTNSLFLPKRSRRPTKSCGKTIQIYSFISRHGLNVNVAPKTGVAKTYPCHTTFQTGVAAATPATPLPAPLSSVIYGQHAGFRWPAPAACRWYGGAGASLAYAYLTFDRLSQS